MVKSEHRRDPAFLLVSTAMSANGEVNPEWARQGSNLRPTTYEEPASRGFSFWQIGGLSCCFSDHCRPLDAPVGGLRRGLVAELED